MRAENRLRGCSALSASTESSRAARRGGSQQPTHSQEDEGDPRKSFEVGGADTDTLADPHTVNPPPGTIRSMSQVPAPPGHPYAKDSVDADAHEGQGSHGAEVWRVLTRS